MINRIIRSALDSGTWCSLPADRDRRRRGRLPAAVNRRVSRSHGPGVQRHYPERRDGARRTRTSVTLPLESSLNGLPGVRRIRSVTQQGVSQVTVEFESDVDYWRARQLVTERLAQVLPQLPEGTRPPLLSSLTNRLNEVYEYLVEGDVDPMQLRDIAEFDLRYRILAVPGVASVERLGGVLRQDQVQLDSNRMRALRYQPGRGASRSTREQRERAGRRGVDRRDRVHGAQSRPH